MKTARRKRSARRLDSTTSALDAVRRLNRGLRLAAHNVERDTGLSAAQLFVLEQLDETTPCSLNDLARLTRTDRSSVSGVVDKLLRAGLVKRSAALDDRRRAEVRLTARGARKLNRAPMPPTALLLRGLKRMSPASVQRLERALTELTMHLGFEESAMLFED